MEALLQAPWWTTRWNCGTRQCSSCSTPPGCGCPELVGLTAEHVSLRQGLVRVVGRGNKGAWCPWGGGGALAGALLPGGRAPAAGWHQLGRGVPLQAGPDDDPPDLLAPHQALCPESRHRGTLPHTLRHAFATTCSITAPICGWCRCCWATRISPHPDPTHVANGGSRHCTASTTQSLIASPALQKTARRRFFNTRQGETVISPAGISASRGSRSAAPDPWWGRPGQRLPLPASSSGC